MAERFIIEIITPDRPFYKGETEFVELATAAGEIGIYANHIPTTTVVVPGMVHIHLGEEEKVAAVHGGLAEILGDRVTILAEVAEWPEEIDLARAQAAEERARARIEGRQADVDIARAEFALRKALIRIDTVGYQKN